HLQSFIDRFKAKATKARQAQSRMKALEKMELIALARFGVAGVAEPCAQLAAPHGRLLAPKTIRDGVTVALAGPL
ncbi:cobalamin biosynthesis protein, partial [Burkholderia multivorans]|uniref:cobalamin biosynthesis protein n=1 Tax=Burkholderia multivorans TaxID=87883 RepID=UPI0020B3A2D8